MAANVKLFANRTMSASQKKNNNQRNKIGWGWKRDTSGDLSLTESWIHPLFLESQKVQKGFKKGGKVTQHDPRRRWLCKILKSSRQKKNREKETTLASTNWNLGFLVF
jgi:hypothetical protein